MTDTRSDSPVGGELLNGSIKHRVPIIPCGALNSFSYEDTTPALGREFSNINIVEDVLNAPDAEDRLRDLAYTSRCAKLSYIERGT